MTAFQSRRSKLYRKSFGAARVLTLLCLCFIQLAPSAAWTQPSDPNDPFSFSLDTPEPTVSDSEKSAKDLIAEATLLLQDERLLDARTKLLEALQKDPKNYHAHMLLAGYYMVHVGHFRLALKYVKQAQAIFEEQNGPPPYTSFLQRKEHANILYLLSQARLNLDNYPGALEVLDEYESYKYSADWFPGTKAWVLMKLGRVNEAIQIARAGIFSGADPGRTLNMLGILLSMTGERQASIDVFKQAINYELALGREGQPATPLNNVGEVYKEIFDEPRAASAWLKATSLPDGCEHVLPSLNLALLELDSLNLSGAKRAMDNFESCAAQYPLKNGEEHRALVDMIRGRNAMFSGHSAAALGYIESALEHRQWFGKIGTSPEDLQAALYVSYSQALRQRNNILALTRSADLRARLKNLEERSLNAIKAWWYNRKAQQVLIDELNDLEDIYVRNTDSLLEYPTLGEVLRELPPSTLKKRLAKEEAKDRRSEALPYYQLYFAESLANHGQGPQALKLLNELLAKTRQKYDEALVLRARLVRLGLLDRDSEQYRSEALAIFSISQPALRNYGFKLPVSITPQSSTLTQSLDNTPFMPSTEADSPYLLGYNVVDAKHVLVFSSRTGAVGPYRAQGATLDEALNQLSDEVFSQEIR